ncbi:hypothetical protein [Atribacter laminatus]|nr:hypothetical protein [Atribacter laminatus]
MPLPKPIMLESMFHIMCFGLKADLSTGIGSKHYQYTYYGASKWIIDITYPVIEQPDFTVNIFSEWGLTMWSGMVYYWETVPLME